MCTSFGEECIGHHGTLYGPSTEVALRGVVLPGGVFQFYKGIILGPMVQCHKELISLSLTLTTSCTCTILVSLITCKINPKT